MNDRFTGFRRSSSKAFAYKCSILVYTAVSALLGSVSGPTPLRPPGPVFIPTEKATPPPSVTVPVPAVSFVRGIDISRSAGEPTLGDFQKIRQQGLHFVIVSGWGGVNPNLHASVQLSRAKDAGLLTAGYCYLNFASPLDGGRQVREALTAFGTEWASLGFVAIDVETSARNQLSPGLCVEPPDAIAQQRAVARIAEAVQEVQGAGLSVVIYTKKDDWELVTGDTQRFKHLPLWHPKTIGGDDINQPSLANPGYAFGGWTARIGKQYVLDTFLDDPSIQVDLNVFNLNAFSVSGPNYREAAGFRIVAVE